MSNQYYLNLIKELECPDSTGTNPEHPLVFSKAKGAHVWDAQGEKYLDLCAGFGVLALGHNPDEFKDVWQQLLREDRPPVVHAMGDLYPAQDKANLLQALVDLLPKELSRIGLALSGGQAVEYAMKTAMLATKKSGFIAFEGGYHGLDFGCLALTSRHDFREPFLPWLHTDKVAWMPYAKEPSSLAADFEKAKDQLIQCGVAGVLVEPVQGRAGVIVPPAGWLEELRRLCTQAGIPLIYDEVFTGLGRTGCITHAERVPCDILCLGKSLGGGLPLSACCATEEMMGFWPENKGEAIHTGTFFGHGLACRLGTKFLEALAEQNLCKVVEERSGGVKQLLGEKFSTEIRGEGFLLGAVFEEAGAGLSQMRRMLKERVICLPAGEKAQVLSFTPPLTWDGSLGF